MLIKADILHCFKIEFENLKNSIKNNKLKMSQLLVSQSLPKRSKVELRVDQKNFGVNIPAITMRGI